MHPNRSKATPNWYRVWLGFASLWMFFALVGTWLNYEFLLARGHPTSWGHALRMNISFYAIWAIVLTPVVLFLCARLPLTRKNLVKVIAVHLVAIVALVATDTLIKALVHALVFQGEPPFGFVPRLRVYLFSQTEADIQIYILVAVMGYVLAYYSELRSQEWHAARLENDLIRAELQVLRMQMQPHFLFNTLHSISALVNSNPRAAQKMICSLGELLRMSLAGGDVQEVTLKRELEFVQCYLDIQRVRFMNRLTTEINIDEDVLNAEVPYLFLQPLVENAIKHGVARQPGLGKVEIRACKEDRGVCVSVSNDDPTPHDAPPEHERLGIGLENVRNRLRILYGPKGRLETHESPSGVFRVEVHIPLREATLLGSQTEPFLFAAELLQEKR